MTEHVTIIIMGASGDLARTKLLPALAQLLQTKKIGPCTIIGVASSDQNMHTLIDQAQPFMVGISDETINSMKSIAEYYKLDFNDTDGYRGLEGRISALEQERGTTDRLFYLATLPTYFEGISRSLVEGGLATGGNGWRRIVYEKPFGHDLASAQAINRYITSVFDEKNICRADHYLGKELISSISLFRFTNRILEPLWSRHDIDSVQIIIDEDGGIKNRGAYYDSYGAVKDILQSHALQILALLAIESPRELTGEGIREKKADVLKMTKVDDILLGQYDGYTNEPRVKADSRTETFFAAKLSIDNERWNGVPFYVRSGKCLNKKESVIHIRFKDVDCLLAKSCPSDNNYLTIHIQPDEGFSFELNSKAVAKNFEVEAVHLDYSHQNMHDPNTPEAYVVLLEQALLGEQSFFIRTDEIEYAWNIVDRIPMDGPVFRYPQGSSGPKEMDEWCRKHGMVWKS